MDLQDRTKSALTAFNSDHAPHKWDFGMNWSNVDYPLFETFINKYLFPKVTATESVNIALGNRFEHLAEERDFIGQYSEEYVILDSVPVNMNLSQDELLMLKRNYPRMATKLFKQGILKKQKFTLNNNDVRFNFQTLGDATEYALSVLTKKISDINVEEEREIKTMLVDYAMNQTKEVRNVLSENDLFHEVFNALLNLQNNSDKYNETQTASGGALGRYTTTTPLEDVAILTTDRLKTFLLNEFISNKYNVDGIDISNRIYSFDDLGGSYRLTSDVTVTNVDTLNYLRGFGDYQIEQGSVIPEGTVFTFDVSELTNFVGKTEEIKPDSDLFAYVFDTKKIRYPRTTKDMLKPPFYNGEFDEVTYWLHYYSSKNMSPFYNSITITGTE